jgi:hypothetical protein
MNNEIEKIQQTFLDDVFIIPQNETVYRMDQYGDRYYFKIGIDGKPIVKASTTTIIKKYSPMSPFLLQWWCDQGYENAKAAMKESSMYGTFAHILWSKLLLRFNIDMSEAGIKQQLNEYFTKENEEFKYNFKEWHKKIKQDLIGFVQWVQDYKVKPIAIEMSIIGEKYSGTVDLVCQMEDKGQQFTAIVDWKSGRNDFYDDYVIQLESYRQLWNEKFPERHADRIERVFNYGCKDFRLPIGKSVIPYRFKEQTDNPIRSRWDFYCTMFNNEHPVLNIEKKTEIRETVINIETQITDLIKEIDPLELLGEENAEK